MPRTARRPRREQEDRPRQRRRRKANPDDEGGWGATFGLLAAAIGGGIVGYKLYSGPTAPPAPPAQRPQYPQFMPQQQQHPQLNGMGAHGQVMEYSQNGIPVVSLPAESALRTAQARRHQPQMFQPAGMLPNGAVPQQGQVQTETFGGEQGNMGGERF